jgi:hypothetical protein
LKSGIANTALDVQREADRRIVVVKRKGGRPLVVITTVLVLERLERANDKSWHLDLLEFRGRRAYDERFHGINLEIEKERKKAKYGHGFCFWLW